MAVDTSNSLDAAASAPVFATPLDLVNRFGDIPLWRIHFDPPPGQATEEHCLAINESSSTLCELVDGTLIERAIGTYESLIAANLLTELNIYLKRNRLGIALGADAMLQLRVKLIRLPDVSFIAKEKLECGKFPHRGVAAALAPTIAVEVISPANSKGEMQDKFEEYFRCGAREVWYVYPPTKTLVRYTSPTVCETLAEQDTLSSPVLPGFQCPLGTLFAHPDDFFSSDAV